MSDGRASAILSIDFEDWHQLVHRSLGLPAWDRPHVAFDRQLSNLLTLLDELAVKATFFVLGMCARHYRDAVRDIAASGHELASHGFAHVRVHDQTPDEFRRDVAQSIALIESAVGRRPIGYRAPAFSITRGSAWAYDVLAELGFEYDSSQYDSPRIPGRIAAIPREPYRLELASGRTLVEFPIAVTPFIRRTVPIGGGSYWRMLPEGLILRALRATASPHSPPVLYFHPYEFDPQPLAASVPVSASWRQRLGAARTNLYWNARRGQIGRVLRAAAREFRFVTYEHFLASNRGCGTAGTKTLSQEGVFV